MADPVHPLFKDPGQPPAAVPIPFQQMKGHSLGRFRAHTRQTSQGIHQLIQQGAFRHGLSEKFRKS
jgi:hypothetical protein